MIYRKSCQFSIALVVLLSFGVGRTALGAATLTEDNRELRLRSSAFELPDHVQFGPEIFVPNFGEPLDHSLSTPLISPSASGNVETSSNASQVSSFDSSPLFTTFAASGVTNAFGTNNGVVEDAGMTTSGESFFDIQFSIDTPQDWSIVAMINESAGQTRGEIALRPVGGANIFWWRFSGSDFGTLNESASGTLQPGSYELSAVSGAFVNEEFNPGTFSTHAELSFEFNIVPEPLTGMLVLLGASLCLRRGAKA